MSAIMLRRALRDLRWSVLWFAAGTAFYVLAIASFYPTVRDNADKMNEMMDAYPEALKRAFAIDDLTSYSGFLGAEALNVIWPLIAAVFLIVAGSAVVAGEIERGTVDLWLSVPVARWKLLASRLGAILAGASVLILATILAVLAGAWLVGEGASASGMAALGLTMLAFSVVVLGYSALLSSLVSSRGLAAGIASGVTLLSYLAWIISGLSSGMHWVRFLSIFAAYDAQPALAHGTLNWGGIAVLFLLGGVCLALALAWFNRRDAIG